jgi:hypothetical protein
MWPLIKSGSWWFSVGVFLFLVIGFAEPFPPNTPSKAILGVWLILIFQFAQVVVISRLLLLLHKANRATEKTTVNPTT